MDDQVLRNALDLVGQFNYKAYINTLLEYWEDNPPIPGHAFCHAIKTAVESYCFGQENSYANPECLFLGGLFHDIYRPAEGANGEEDHRYGAEIVSNLFDKYNLNSDAKNLIKSAITSHDEWRKSDKEPPIFDLLLSLGDKAAIDTIMTNTYVWINNKKSVTANGKPIYANHFETLAAFFQYQKRAWDIFAKYKYIIGIDRSINAYLNILKSTVEMYEKDPEGKHFNEYTDEQAKLSKRLETDYLNNFNIENSRITKILTQYDL